MNILIDDESLIVGTQPVNMFQMNQYVIVDKESGDAAIIDAGGKPAPFLDFIEKQGGQLVAVWQTHAHIDHIIGLEDTLAAADVPVYLHPDDYVNLEYAPMHAQHLGIPAPNPPKPDKTLAEGDTMTLGGLTFDVLHTPGHAPGHVCFYNDEHSFMFGGDLLFRRSIGRTDLPGCNQQDMAKSLKRVSQLPADTQVFPGHMQPTTIGAEKKDNPFLRSM
jgi:glyoxylase-like metal-dependent hydrolase (beta-lactamase superfamily II)